MKMQQKQQGFTLIELMIVVAIIGILAAVAIPSYRDYTARAQMSEAISLLSGFKTGLAEYHQSEGTFTPPTALKVSDFGSTVSGKYVRDIVFTGAGTNTIQIAANMKASTSGVSSEVAGGQLRLKTTDGGKKWACEINSGGKIQPRHLPSACR